METKEIKFYTWQESYDMCGLGRCKWWSYDMDDSFCAHPESLKIAPVFYASTNRMIAEGLCTGCNSDPAKNLRQLWEPCETKTPA